MPNCFSLCPIGSDEAMPLNYIDEFVCHSFGIKADAVRYGGAEQKYDWYNSIGFMLATGKTFEQIINDKTNHWNERILPMAKLLSNWFCSDAWVEIGRQ